MKKHGSLLMLALAGISSTVVGQTPDIYTQRFIDLRAKIVNPANGYFSKDGAPNHSIETLMVEAPDFGHETTSEAWSYYIWLETMHGRVSKDWTPLANAWTKMETLAIPQPDQQPTNSGYNPNNPATYAPEFELPDQYPAPLTARVLSGQDPVSPDLTAAYGANIYGMHWIFDNDNFYGYGNKGDGVSTPSYINTFQRGEQESTWETVPHPSWESFRWGSNDGSGFLKLFVGDTGTPTPQWRYTNAPDADSRAVQAIYWGLQFAKEQGLAPATVLPLAKAAKLGDFGRLALFDKYFRSIGVQNQTSPGGTGYSSAHYLTSWYYAWGGPITPQGWAFRIGASHVHFGYQNPVAAYALSVVPELRPATANGPRDWATSLNRQLEFYEWLQSAEGAIAGGATNSFNGRYDPYPAGTPTFYGMAYQENPVYKDPGSNTWFGFQAWSMERVAEYYYITNDARAKRVLDRWIPWARGVVTLTPDGAFTIPSDIAWTGAPNTWNPAAPVRNTNLHISIVTRGQDLGISAALAKTFTYYAAGTQRWATLDTVTQNMAKTILDRMWTSFYQPNGKGVVVEESRSDFRRLFDQTVFVPAGWSGRMANGDVIAPGIKFIDIRSKYRSDPDFPALQAAYNANVPYRKAFHRFWAQVDIALANAEYGRFFAQGIDTRVTGVTVTPVSTSVGIGATVALTATVAPANATNRAVTWTSSAPAVATVNATGVVTGVSAGSAMIMVRTVDGNFTATSSVSVSNIIPQVTGVTVSPTTVSVAAGATTALTATVLPAAATNRAVIWTSSAPTIASVSATGVVTGVVAGSATITVRTVSGSFTATTAVTVTPVVVVIPVTSVTVTPSPATVAVGATAALTATVNPANATNRTVTWTSSAPAIATVSATGVVTGVAAGSATITATAGGISGSSVVTVRGVPTPVGCTTPATITVPFAVNGPGEFCYFTTGNINFVNSWNAQLVEINGVAFTNRWSNALPARVNGGYTIRYIGTFPWSHLELN